MKWLALVLCICTGIGAALAGKAAKVAEPPELKVHIEKVKVLSCSDCGDNAIAKVTKADVILAGDFAADAPLVCPKSVFDYDIDPPRILLKAEVKFDSPVTISECSHDWDIVTFDCCNPEQPIYVSPLIEDACDVFQANGRQHPYKCFGGSGSHRGLRTAKNRGNGDVCVKKGKVTKTTLHSTLILNAPNNPSVIDAHTGCYQSEGHITDVDTNEVIACLRIQWSLCAGSDCGGGEAFGCNDDNVFENPKCSRCIQGPNERFGECIDWLKFGASPQQTCAWRQCCCDTEGTGGTPCNGESTGTCSDQSCRRKHNGGG